MIYRNTPLDDNLLSPMQLLQGRVARSDLPMSHAAKVKYGLVSGRSLPAPVKVQDKNERAPTHDYKLNQHVMYLDTSTKKWFPATIVRVLVARQSYLIRTPEGVEYRRTQQHLKPYKPKVYRPPAKQRDCTPAQGRPKCDTKAPEKLDLEVSSHN